MKRKKYLKGLGSTLINIGTFLECGSKVSGMEKAINDVPLEFFEDLKDLIDGEIIFRKKDKDDSFESHLLGESENIH